MNSSTNLSHDASLVVDTFAKALGGIRPDFRVKSRPDGEFLIFEFSNPPPHIYDVLNKVNEQLPVDNSFRDRCSIGKRDKKPASVLAMPETALLQRELSQSLTVDRNTFGDEFLSRYTPSVTNLERDVVLQANHVVYGRRGSGKSSLLAYQMHHLRQKGFPFAWIAMQAYSSRTDKQAIASVLSEIFSEAAHYAASADDFKRLSGELDELGEADDEAAVNSRLMRLVPRLRRMLGEIASADRCFTVFLDDLHVLGKELQPDLLGFLYSLARGNHTYIKVSGIEQLTNLWDGVSKRGLEAPHDIQTLMLDHNLTSPDQSKEHIKSILDRHATYCGLPGIEYIAADDFMDRLVLSAAAVPRDALSLFSKSIARSLVKKQRVVSVTSLNAATSEAVEEKLKDVEKDVSSEEKKQVSACLEQVKNFCLKTQKKNAFLVKIVNGSKGYINIQRLTALRFVHLLHEGITPHKAGERYIALMLDYGFYIGMRTAKSITLFPDKPRPLAAKELRNLSIFVPT